MGRVIHWAGRTGPWLVVLAAGALILGAANDWLLLR